MYRKLLIRNLNEVEEIIEVGEGGGYFDESRILWDESKQGPMPPAKVAAHAARLIAQAQAQDAKDAARAVVYARLKNHNPRASKSIDELRDIVADLLEIVKG